MNEEVKREGLGELINHSFNTSPELIKSLILKEQISYKR